MTDTVYIPDSDASPLERMRQHIQFLMGSNRSLNGFQITVQDGAHAGVITTFESDPCTIGGGSDCNVILLGDGLASTHARLTPSGRMGRGLRLDAVEGPVEVEGYGTLMPGEWMELSGRTSLGLGRAVVDIGPILDTGQLTRALIFIASIALLSFIVISLVMGTWRSTNFGLKMLASPASVQQSAIITYAAHPAVSVPVALQAAREALANAGLAHMIRLQPVGDSTLKADGIVPDSVAGEWTGFLQWYDGKRGFPPLVNAVSVSGDNQDLPSISTVWLGQTPLVEFTDGTRGQIGSVLEGGWRIVGIDRSAVSLERNGATISVTY